MHPPRWPAAVATAVAVALAPACTPDPGTPPPGTAFPGPPPQRPVRPPDLDTADVMVPPGAIGLGRGWEFDTETVEFDTDFLDPLIGPSPCPAERRAADLAHRALEPADRSTGVYVRADPGDPVPDLTSSTTIDSAPRARYRFSVLRHLIAQCAHSTGTTGKGEEVALSRRLVAAPGVGDDALVERRAAAFAGRNTVEVEYAYARIGGVIVTFRGRPGRAAPHLPTAAAFAARAAG